MDKADHLNRDRWMGLARRVSRHVNAGWWLHYLRGPSVAIGLAGSAAALLLRHRELPLEFLWIGASLVLLAAALAACVLARRRFYTIPDALVRIESHNRLHNALTAANEGAIPWPDYNPVAGGGLVWRWKQVTLPPLVAVLSLLAALLVPIRRGDAATAARLSEPPAWTEVRETLERLRDEGITDDPAAQALQQALDDLQRQPREEWYSHGSLEAGDHLKEQLSQALSDMGRQFAALENVLSTGAATAAERQPDGLSSAEAIEPSDPGTPAEPASGFSALDPAELKSLQEQWKDAMEGLSNAALKIDPALLNSLSGIDPSRLRQLSPEECRRMLEQLGQCQGACRASLEPIPGDGAPTNLVIVAATAAGAMNPMPGAGAPTRGPGEAPLNLSKPETDPGSGRSESLPDRTDGARQAGDLIGLMDGRHEVKPGEMPGIVAGGEAASGGAGDAVWRTRLAPDEEQALKRIFTDRRTP